MMSPSEQAELGELIDLWGAHLASKQDIKRCLELMAQQNAEIAAANAKENELIWGESHDTGRR